MRLGLLFHSGIVLFVAAVLSGCGRPYRIIQNLEEPLQTRSTCAMGNIVDALPADFDEARKPSAEDIEKFKHYLREGLADKNIFTTVSTLDAATEYELRGSILAYSRGSGGIRFLFGTFGEAGVTAQLELVRRADERVVFSGSFRGGVASYTESGDKMFQQVAKSFAKALDKQVSKMIREK